MTTGMRDRAATLRGAAEQLRPVLDGSTQGIYIYLDDDHKVCNAHFARMLGYESPADWAREGSFTDLYVDGPSRHTLVSAYQHAMQQQAAAVIDVTWKRRDGGTQASTVQMAPIAFGGELLALHFVTPR